MSLLKQNIIRKSWFIKQKYEFNSNDNTKYNIKVICDYKMYINKVAAKLLGLYYLISWKNYNKFKNI